MSNNKKAILIIVLFSIITSLPFIFKPYHVDDPVFIYVAEQVIKDPLRPYSFNLEWSSDSGQASHMDDTPLVSYFAALAFILSGRTEASVHVLLILFHIIAGISFYYIAKRFLAKNALIATLIMIATPTFLVMSNNVMPDVPMISLFLLAAALFIYGVDKMDHRLMFLGSFVAGMSYLTKPNAIVILPLLALYALLRKKPKYMLYVLTPVIMIILWSIHNHYIQDDVLILGYIPFLLRIKASAGGAEIYLAYFISNLSYIGGATLFPFFFLYPFLNRKRNWIFLIASLISTMALAAILYKVSVNFISGQYTLFQLALFVAFITSSTFFILVVIADNYKKIGPCIKNIFSITKSKCDFDTFFLLVWFFGVYILNSGISGGSVKYNTLFLPPLLLVYMTMFRKYSIKYKLKMRIPLIILLLTTATVGLGVAFADLEFARVYKHFSYNVADEYKTSDNTLWIRGHYGFQYYMVEKGHVPIPLTTNEPKKGDIIIKARIPSPRSIAPELEERTELIKTVSYDGLIPIRVQNGGAHSGFYTYGGGFLPYSFSKEKLENFDIFLVARDP